MHPYANPLVIAWWVRHPQSAAIHDDTYYGDSELSELGEKQIQPLARQLRSLKLDLILCSPMVRTTKVLLESNMHVGNLLQTEDALAEWPRAESMLGRKNSEPEVIQYLKDRVERFQRRRRPLPGEERFEDTVDKMGKISERLIDFGSIIRARKGRAARVGLLSHGNRGRQYWSWVKAKGDPRKFRREFLDLYDGFGVEPTAIMGPFWFGNFFRSPHRGWNGELGWVHLPRPLRESEI